MEIYWVLRYEIQNEKQDEFKVFAKKSKEYFQNREEVKGFYLYARAIGQGPARTTIIKLSSIGALDSIFEDSEFQEINRKFQSLTLNLETRLLRKVEYE